MRQFRKYGSVRGVSGNRLLYRDRPASRTSIKFPQSGLAEKMTVRF